MTKKNANTPQAGDKIGIYVNGVKVGECPAQGIDINEGWKSDGWDDLKIEEKYTAQTIMNCMEFKQIVIDFQSSLLYRYNSPSLNKLLPKLVAELDLITQKLGAK